MIDLTFFEFVILIFDKIMLIYIEQEEHEFQFDNALEEDDFVLL
jgi:hypothetical protein